MEPIKFEKFRESYRNLLAEMPDDHFTASMGESIIKSLPMTLAEKALLQADLELMLQYKVRSWNMVQMLQRVADQHEC